MRVSAVCGELEKWGVGIVDGVDIVERSLIAGRGRNLILYP
jgi:hypothetical protein